MWVKLTPGWSWVRTSNSTLPSEPVPPPVLVTKLSTEMFIATTLSKQELWRAYKIFQEPRCSSWTRGSDLLCQAGRLAGVWPKPRFFFRDRYPLFYLTLSKSSAREMGKACRLQKIFAALLPGKQLTISSENIRANACHPAFRVDDLLQSLWHYDLYGP